jgi:hypothetical protein
MGNCSSVKNVEQENKQQGQMQSIGQKETRIGGNEENKVANKEYKVDNNVNVNSQQMQTQAPKKIINDIDQKNKTPITEEQKIPVRNIETNKKITESENLTKPENEVEPKKQITKIENEEAPNRQTTKIESNKNINSEINQNNQSKKTETARNLIKARESNKQLIEIEATKKKMAEEGIKGYDDLLDAIDYVKQEIISWEKKNDSKNVEKFKLQLHMYESFKKVADEVGMKSENDVKSGNKEARIKDLMKKMAEVEISGYDQILDAIEFIKEEIKSCEEKKNSNGIESNTKVLQLYEGFKKEADELGMK